MSMTPDRPDLFQGKNITRREFLKVVATTSAATFLATYKGSLSTRTETSPTLTPTDLPAPSVELKSTVDQTAKATELEKSTITSNPMQTAENRKIVNAAISKKIELPTAVETIVYPDDWKNIPIKPVEISKAMMTMFISGSKVLDTTHFSIIGDCQTNPNFFLGSRFTDPLKHNLGQYNVIAKSDWFNTFPAEKSETYLARLWGSTPIEETISFYKDSLNRRSSASKGGMNAAAVLNSLFSSKACGTNSPLVCEIGEWHPAWALVNFEEFWGAVSGSPDKYKKYTQSVVEKLLVNSIIPVLATSTSDNVKNGITFAMNQTIKDLAQEYQLPVWNLWTAVQILPNHGLNTELDDGFHLSGYTGDNRQYDYSSGIKTGWAMRNLTALMLVHSMRLGLSDALKRWQAGF